jgi:hypothetical protein
MTEALNKDTVEQAYALIDVLQAHLAYLPEYDRNRLARDLKARGLDIRDTQIALAKLMSAGPA